MTFFALKPALVRTIKPAMKQMAASIRIARISSNFTEPGIAAVIGFTAVTRPWAGLQDQQHRDIDRQDDEQPADQRGFHEFSNRSHLGLRDYRSGNSNARITTM
jgi:hypothetical protein